MRRACRGRAAACVPAKNAGNECRLSIELSRGEGFAKKSARAREGAGGALVGVRAQRSAGVMKWALKFSTKNKKDGQDGAKSAGVGVESFRATQATGERRGFSSEGEAEQEDEDSRTPIVTPPDANGVGGAEGEKGGEEPPADGSAPPFTVDGSREGAEDGADPKYDVDERRDVQADRGDRADDQRDVFDDDSQEDADSLHASRAARMQSFADDPEGHALGDPDADWDGEDSSSVRTSGIVRPTAHSGFRLLPLRC